MSGTHVCGKQAGEEDADEGDDRERAPGHVRGEDASSIDDSHGKPPFGERPGRPLPHAARAGQDVIAIVRGGTQVQVGEEVGQVALEALFGRHASRPSAIGTWVLSGSTRTVVRLATSA